MSYPYGKSDDSSSMKAEGPQVFVGETQFSFEAVDAAAPVDTSQPLASEPLCGWTPAAKGALPTGIVTAATVLLALLLCGVVGYLVGRGSHDVSVSGQVAYACALIENVEQTHRSPEDWGMILEDQAYSDVAAVSGLLGGLVAYSQDRKEFQEFGQLLGGLDRLDPRALTSSVAATHKACDNR